MDQVKLVSTLRSHVEMLANLPVLELVLVAEPADKGGAVAAGIDVILGQDVRDLFR